MWVATNDKIVFKVQKVTQSKSFINDDLGNLREGIVTSVGSDVNEIEVGGKILLPMQDITHLQGGYGVCSERNIIAMNNTPTQSKLEVKLLEKDNEFEKLLTGEIIKVPITTIGKYKVGDRIKFKDRTFQVIDDSRVLLPESKVFLVEDK